MIRTLVGIIILTLGVGLLAASLLSDRRIFTGGDNGGRVSLAGPWKISLADSEAYASPAYDDSSWETIDLPANLMKRVYEKGKGMGGVLWLRKTFFLDGARGSVDRGLILGRIACADETWLNGARVGGMGRSAPGLHSMWNHPRYYRVSGSLLRPGAMNTIAVRVSYYMFGEVRGTLALADLDDWTQSGIVQHFLIIELNYIFMALGVIIFIMYLFFSIKRPGEEEYMYFCLQIVCGFFIVLEPCLYWDLYGSALLRLQVLVMAWVAITTIHPIFLHRLYRIERRRTEAALCVYFLAALSANVYLAAQPGASEALILATGAVLTVVACAAGAYNTLCHVEALRKRHPYARILGFIGIIAILGALHDGFVYLTKITGMDFPSLGVAFQVMVFPYAAAVMFIGSALVLTFRFIRMMSEVEDLNNSLESFVIENAFLSERLKTSRRIKGRAAAGQEGVNLQERMNRMIHFINEHYNDRISRAALADKADVHPDSLSRLFKRFTGKKLGDYINELRMKEAAARLVETDDNVTDIAFSVGFDSIRTFNRLFPRFMGMTPERYRRTFREGDMEMAGDGM